MILAPAVVSGGLYCPAQDRALSADGGELRASVQSALAAPNNPSRTERILESLQKALRKGTEIEGVLLGAETFGRVCYLLAILPATIPIPEVVVESETAVGLDWQEGSRRVLTVTVDDQPSLGFAALFGHEPLHGRMPFAGDIPETLGYLFKRLYPASSGRSLSIG